MGGLVCEIHKNAVLRYQKVPTDAAGQAAFDVQIRELYNVNDVAQTIVNETTEGVAICKILMQPTFAQTDRQKLLDVINSLYSYPSGYT